MTPETEELLSAIERLDAIDRQGRSSVTAMQYNCPGNYNIGNTVTILCEALADRLAPNRKKDNAL